MALSVHDMDYVQWDIAITQDMIRTVSELKEYSKNQSNIERVIFNDPATIIIWKDGTKTVVKCQEGDTYNKETGFVMCYLKKLLGNDNTFNKEITKWVVEDGN